MTDDDVKQYRATVDTQLREKENDIETTTSYITLGLLGFFLTINEKFIPFYDSKYQNLFFIGVGSFVLSFILGIISKYLTTRYDKQVIKMLDTTALATTAEEDILTSKLTSINKNLFAIRVFVNIFLVSGLIAQLGYFILNVKQKPIDKTNIKMELTIPTRDTSINIKNTEIHIYQKNK